MATLIEDLSVLTDVSEPTLKKFIPVSIYCLSHNVFETLHKNENISEIDIGIGQLCIKIESNSVKYRFIPSKELDKCVTQAVTTGCSPMITKIDTSLQEKIERAFKELI